MSSISINVTTMKGATCQVTMSLDATVGDLRQEIASRVFHGDVDELKVLYRAKYLSDSNQRLSKCGFPTGGKPVQLHVVARVNGGQRSAVQEIALQYKYVKRAKLFGVKEVAPEDEFTWNLLMTGPRNSPYRKGVFSITIKFPQDYPYSPPSICFNTPIFHPNVFDDGSLCWHDNDTTGSKYFADIIIGAINTLLEEPNPDSPANGEAAELFTRNRKAFNKRVAEMLEN